MLVELARHCKPRFSGHLQAYVYIFRYINNKMMDLFHVGAFSHFKVSFQRNTQMYTQLENSLIFLSHSGNDILILSFGLDWFAGFQHVLDEP